MQQDFQICFTFESFYLFKCNLFIYLFILFYFISPEEFYTTILKFVWKLLFFKYKLLLLFSKGALNVSKWQ